VREHGVNRHPDVVLVPPPDGEEQLPESRSGPPSLLAEPAQISGRSLGVTQSQGSELGRKTELKNAIRQVPVVTKRALMA